MSSFHPHVIPSRLPWIAAFGLTLCLTLCLALCLAPASPAWAEPAEVNAADRETARTLLDEGDALYQQQRYPEAADKYRAADDIMGVPSTALPLGKALQAMGKLVEARDAYLRAVRFSGPSNAAFHAAKQEADRLAQAVQERIATLALDVLGPPKGATIRLAIDGTSVSGAARQRSINPGTHQLRVEAEGFQPASMTVTLAEGETKTVSVKLEPVGSQSAPERPPPEGGASFPVWATAGFSVGAAGLIVGAITGGVSLSKASELADACPEMRCGTQTELQSTQDEALLMANISNAGFVVGGVGIAFGIIALFTLDAGDSDRSATRIEPRLGPGYVGVGGAF